MMERVYQPRQRTDGRWEYSICIEGATHVVGYCAGWHYDDGAPFEKGGALAEAWGGGRAAAAPFMLKYHTDGHGTGEEARRCFNTFLLDHHISVAHARTEEPCVSCGVGTVRRVSVGNLHTWPVCAKHEAHTLASEFLAQEPAIRNVIVQAQQHPPAQEKNIAPAKEVVPAAASNTSRHRASLPGPLDQLKGRG